MRVAVFLDTELRVGGGFQQSLSNMALFRRPELADHQLVVLVADKAQLSALRQDGYECHYFRLSWWKQALLLALRSKVVNRVPGSIVQTLNVLERTLDRLKVDLVFFLSPSMKALFLDRFSYLFTVWDLCHRDHPEFPEVRFKRDFELREYLYQHALPKASAVFVDSGLGKANVVRRYGLDEEKVRVLPYSPALGVRIGEGEYQEHYVDVRSKYGLSGEYVYYPAQFWPHKNHVYLLRGLSLLKRSGHTIEAVFTGADKGNLHYVLEQAEDLGVREQVHYLGFVPNEDIAYLYRQSLALVMPTFFGPTNIPPLEAFYLGTPVLYSDLPGLREQVGEAALLLDLNDPQDLADKILLLKSDPVLKQKLQERGKRELSRYSDSVRAKVLSRALQDFAGKRCCWR